MSVMSAFHDLFVLADAYADATGLAEGTVSDRVLKGGNRLRDLRAGKGDIGIRRLEQAIKWFSNHWPEGVDWPDTIDRPPVESPADSEPVE
ncbi:hypothetical protein [Beijerinckia sp. L45]|uniref:hypothetical protein n=1 Tax=Beijerinckia sp. L45 TaxID=1641855 RepID=UPI001FEF7695|nr:hypothetical protein [Beijerinckia sp. L45]